MQRGWTKFGGAACLTGLGLVVALVISHRNERRYETTILNVGSFQVDPETGKIVDGRRDYTNPQASELLKLVITDWMTNPEVMEIPYRYLIDPDDEAGKTPKLQRLLIDKRYVPADFKLDLPGVRVENIDRSKRDLQKGEMCIRIDRFKPVEDDVIEIQFVHSGYGIMGGAWATYRAKNTNGEWETRFAGSFDP